MAITATAYDHVPKIFANGAVDWDTDTIKLALVTSSYTPSAAHTQYEDVMAYEITDSSYTIGGETLANAAADNSKLDADDVTFTNLSATFRYAILYKDGVTGDTALNSPLLAYYLMDNTPADVTVSNSDYTVPWNANGVFTY